jgi:hypothetical protein
MNIFFLVSTRSHAKFLQPGAKIAFAEQKNYELKAYFFIQGVFEVEAFLVTLYIILKNFSLNLLSKMFVLTEIIDCIFLLFSKILSPILSISPLH